MLEKVSRLFQRPLGIEQTRAANWDDDIAEEALRPQAIIVAGAEADGDVDIVEVEIARVVGNVEAQVDAGVQPAELHHLQHQPFGGEFDRHADTQRRRAAREFLDAGGGARQRFDTVFRRVAEDRARLREPQAAAGPVKEDGAQLILDLLDLMAYGRRRQSQFIRRAGEIQVSARCQQGLERSGSRDEQHRNFKNNLKQREKLSVSLFLINAS